MWEYNQQSEIIYIFIAQSSNSSEEDVPGEFLNGRTPEYMHDTVFVNQSVESNQYLPLYL